MAEMYYVHKWNDSRLAANDRRNHKFVMTPDEAEAVWRPDPFFTEAVKVERMSVPVENHVVKFFGDTRTVMVLEK